MVLHGSDVGKLGFEVRYIGPDPDPDRLYAEYQAMGVNFHQPLRVDGDGLLGFEVADADGYILFFGGRSRLRDFADYMEHC